VVKEVQEKAIITAETKKIGFVILRIKCKYNSELTLSFFNRLKTVLKSSHRYWWPSYV